MMRILSSVFLLIFSAAMQAAPVTIDFGPDAISTIDGSECRVESDGFVFLSDSPGTCIYQTPGLDLLVLDRVNSVGAFTMVAASGASFSVDSLLFGSADLQTLTITGHLASGGTVQTGISGPGNLSVGFDSSWVGIESLELSVNGPGYFTFFDDIVVDVVPIPAAVWLFGSALFGLGFLRRNT